MEEWLGYWHTSLEYKEYSELEVVAGKIVEFELLELSDRSERYSMVVVAFGFWVVALNIYQNFVVEFVSEV